MERDKKLYDKVVMELNDLEINKFQDDKAKTYLSQPSIYDLIDILNHIKEVLFPIFVKDEIKYSSPINHFSNKLEIIYELLQEQIRRGLCFSCSQKTYDCFVCDEEAHNKARSFIERLPLIKQLLLTDVKAAYNGDPAAKSSEEIILCYPSIEAITHYRIAHELWQLGVKLLPRMIMEILHSKTGIDIHPGARIGKYFFIDHGTGVVIGETTIIGDNVRLYQGVTLGAKNFPLDDKGKPIKGIERHPIIKDNVIIYSNATILGRITIGENSVIGGNTWIVKNVPPNSKIFNL
ncbi:MAG: cysE [Bacteroidetes bacterium]|nr:cysE [Bacteroidota bacterium]